jgi:excisionase family DNA binding protein
MTRSDLSSQSAGRRGAGGGSPRGGELVPLAEPLLDCVAAAALLNVRVSWVRDAARLGRLPCVRVGRHLRFTRLMLEDWLAGQVVSSRATGRGYPHGGGTPRVKGSPFRRGTSAALLASLAETPKRPGG